MNLQNIFANLEKIDTEVYDRINHMSRRHMFNMLTQKATAAVAPAVLATVVTNTYAQTPGLTIAVVETLNFALTLEYLEAEFYNTGLATAGLIPGIYRPVFEQLAKHENAHVNLLRSALGSRAVSKPTFDYTAGGTYPTVFSNFGTFLNLSIAFEDTGVRAYKGKAGDLMENPAILRTALQIHSVEARHAARVRSLDARIAPLPWITENIGMPMAVYAGDENLVQRGFDTESNTIATFTASVEDGVPRNRATEAYDEPLTEDQVVAIVRPFLVRFDPFIR